MSQFVAIYHPDIPETITAPKQVSLASVDDWAALGWLLVDENVTPPTSSLPYFTRAETLSQVGAGTGPLGGALREAFGTSVRAAPAGFGFTHLTLPTVTRRGYGDFFTSLDVQSLRPVDGATYYVGPNGVAGNNGATSASPLDLPTALTKADVGTIIYAPGEYYRNTHTTAATTKSINHLAAAPGVKVTGWNNPGSTAWTLTSGSIYQTSRSATTQVVDVTNRTDWGDYTKYEKRADLASITGSGQWAIVGSTVYVWAIGDTDLTVQANRYQIRLGLTARTGIVATAGTQYVRGIDFEGCDDGGACAQGTAIVIAENCTFRYSMGNGGAQAVGGHGYIAVWCEASSNAADGFNYHGSAGVSPDFIEIDCRSHHNGLLAPGTNNASTAHESVRGLRVGGDYGVAGGPVVADVNSARTWTLGSRVGQATPTDAQGHSVRVDATGFEGDPAQMWLDECTIEGSRYAYKATGSGIINVHGNRARGTVDAVDTSDATGVLRTYEAA